MRLGSNVIATGAQTGNTNTSKTNVAWSLSAIITVASTGSGGTLNTFGSFSYANNTFVAVANGTSAGSQTPQTPVTLNLTTNYTFDLNITSSSTGNSWSMTGCSIEVLG